MSFNWFDKKLSSITEAEQKTLEEAIAKHKDLNIDPVKKNFLLYLDKIHNKWKKEGFNATDAETLIKEQKVLFEKDELNNKIIYYSCAATGVLLLIGTFYYMFRNNEKKSKKY